MKKIGKYVIRGLLGRGGMSTVYKVTVPVLEKIVALKLFHPPQILLEMVGEAPLKERFITEAKTMAAIRHPHVADVWDFDFHEEAPFFVMEFFCNSLGHLIGERPEAEKSTRQMTPEKIFHYGRQILDGLHGLHQAGIIHRDIKPFNILLTDHDNVKIADFGLSRLHGESTPTPDNINVGSPFYCAPEQKDRPDSVDLRADLYSLGIMLYRLLIGTLPGSSQEGDQELHREFMGISAPFWKKAIAHNPQERYSSAQEMIEALSRLADEWEAQKTSRCLIVKHREEQKTGTGNKPLPPLRTTPIKIDPLQAKRQFRVNQFWRPSHPVHNQFIDNGDGTVFDQTTNLTWQQAGSIHPCTWDDAKIYVKKLNKQQFAGGSNWRLPTSEELLSLLSQKTSIHDYCLEPVFDQGKKSLWSIDNRSALSAWYANLDMGFLGWLDTHCSLYVRAVTSGHPA